MRLISWTSKAGHLNPLFLRESVYEGGRYKWINDEWWVKWRVIVRGVV